MPALVLPISIFVMLRALALILIAALAAPTNASTLERGNGAEPDTLDAHRAQSLGAFNVLRDLYDGLVAEDADGALVPGLAEAWRVSTDRRVWTFTLGADARWSDGRPLVARDVVASFRRALDPATLAPYSNLLAPIANATAIGAGRAPAKALGIAALDARTVLVILDRPAPLDRLMTLPIAFIVDVDAAVRLGARHTRAGNLISNGAYRLVDWQPQTEITLERNRFYRDADKVAIERVRWHATEDPASELKRFIAGDLDITDSVPPGNFEALKARFGAQLRIAPLYGTFYFGFNLRRAPFAAAPKLREALSLAIDRDILTRHVTGFGEAPAYGLVPPGMSDYPAPVAPAALMTQSARVARARTLYAEAGYGAERPLTTEIRYNTSRPHRRLALSVAAMWRETLGVKTRLVNEEWKVFVVNRRAGRVTEVFRGTWIADYADPMSFLETFRSGQPLNVSGYDDPAFDALLDRASAAGGARARMTLLGEAEARLNAAHAILPVYHYTSKQLVAPRVRGFVANPLDRQPTRFLSLTDDVR